MLRDPLAVLNFFVFYVMQSRHHHLHAYFRRAAPPDRYRLAFTGFAPPHRSLQPLAQRCEALSPGLNDPDVFTLVGPQGGGLGTYKRLLSGGSLPFSESTALMLPMWRKRSSGRGGIPSVGARFTVGERRCPREFKRRPRPPLRPCSPAGDIPTMNRLHD